MRRHSHFAALRLPLWTTVLMTLASCTPKGSSTSSPAPSGPPSTTALAAVTPADDDAGEEAPVPTPPAGPWRDLLIAEKWSDAASALDAMPEADRKRAEMRLARARVAAELSDHPRAIAELDGLETDLPFLADLISRRRAESMLEVGPYDRAGVYYATKTGTKPLTKAALALEKAGKQEDARRVIDRAITSAKGGVSEASARAVRMRLAEAANARDVAIADAHWILLSAPESSSADAAQAVVDRLDASWKPNVSERLVRAEKLAAAGKLEATKQELDAAQKDRGFVPEWEVERARGNDLYKLRRYGEAAASLTKASEEKRNGSHVEDAFHAARALSRANKDEEAIVAYRALVKSAPKTSFADEAEYLAAHLAMLLGKLDEASRGYENYLKRRSGGKHVTAVTYELGLVELSQKQWKRARSHFAELSRAEDNRGEQARLRELEGVAAQKGGDEEGAKSAFGDVIKSQPLSFSALLAAARLTAMGAPVPAAIEPAESASSTPLVVKLPRAADLLHQLGLDDDAEDALHAAESQVTNAFNGRGTEALCQAYGMLDHASRRYRLAQDKVKAETLTRAPSQATRWAWDCLFPAPYAEQVTAVETRDGLPHGLVHGVMRQESAFDPEVISGANAVGLLQLLPVTGREIAKRSGTPFTEGTLTHPAVNVDLGSRYLAALSKTWHQAWPLVFASYNAGPAPVSRWLEHAEGMELDVWVARIPYAETRAYVGRVMGNYARYAYLLGGEAAVPKVSLSLDTTMRAEEGAF